MLLPTFLALKGRWSLPTKVPTVVNVIEPAADAEVIR